MQHIRITRAIMVTAGARWVNFFHELNWKFTENAEHYLFLLIKQYSQQLHYFKHLLRTKSVRNNIRTKFCRNKET